MQEHLKKVMVMDECLNKLREANIRFDELVCYILVEKNKKALDLSQQVLRQEKIITELRNELSWIKNPNTTGR